MYWVTVVNSPPVLGCRKRKGYVQRLGAVRPVHGDHVEVPPGQEGADHVLEKDCMVGHYSPGVEKGCVQCLGAPRRVHYDLVEVYSCQEGLDHILGKGCVLGHHSKQTTGSWMQENEGLCTTSGSRPTSPR